MNNTGLENRYSKHQLIINKMDDYSDKIEFSYYKPKAQKVVNASLIVDLKSETPEQKLASFFSSIEKAKARAINNYNKEVAQLEGDWKAQARASKLYLNIMQMRELCPELEIDDYEIISDEEIEFFRQFKAASTGSTVFKGLSSMARPENGKNSAGFLLPVGWKDKYETEAI